MALDMRALALLAAVAVIYGVNWPVLKFALEHIPPLWFAAMRLAMGAATVFTILALTGRSLAPPERRDWPVVASIGLLQQAAFMVLMNVGLLYVEPGRSSILTYTTPLWVAPGAALFLGERLTMARVIGVGLGMLGVAAMFNPAAFDWGDRQALFGNSLLLLSALGWAVAILHTRGHRWRRGPFELAGWQMLTGMAPVVVIAAIVEGVPRIDWSWSFALAFVYNGPIATAFALWAIVSVTRSVPAVTTSLGLLGVPVIGLLSSWATLGEPLTTDKVAGLVLICAGVAVVTLARPSEDG